MITVYLLFALVVLVLIIPGLIVVSARCMPELAAAMRRAWNRPRP